MREQLVPQAPDGLRDDFKAIQVLEIELGRLIQHSLQLFHRPRFGEVSLHDVAIQSFGDGLDIGVSGVEQPPGVRPEGRDLLQ